MRVDVSNLETDGLPDPPLDVALYAGSILKHEWTKTKTNDPMLSLDIEVIEGPVQENGADPQGRRVFDQLVLPQKTHKDGGKMARVRLNQFLTAAEIPFDDSGFDDDELDGKVVYFRTKQEPFEGEARHRVAKYVPAPTAS